MKKKGRKKEKRLRREILHSRVHKAAQRAPDAEAREQARARKGATRLSGIQREQLQRRIEISSSSNSDSNSDLPTLNELLGRDELAPTPGPSTSTLGPSTRPSTPQTGPIPDLTSPLSVRT
jgi:hypothetical protein